MDKVSKYQYVKEIEKLLNLTSACEGLILTYGSYDENTKTFTPSERNLTGRNDPREMVQLKWGDQSDENCIYRSVEMDSLYAVTLDIMDACRNDLRI